MASTSDDNSVTDSDAAAFEAALQSSLMPCREYFLQGSILVEHVDKLLVVLRGLCDNCEGESETFRDYEASYCAIMKAEDAIKLRVRRSLYRPEEPASIRYLGRTDLGGPTAPTAVRTSIDVKAIGDIGDFVEMLRFRKEFEFVASGYAFRKGRMRITVSRITEAKERGTQVHEYHYVTNSYLVETSVVEAAGISAAGVEMRRFADRLAPLVYMTKPDF